MENTMYKERNYDGQIIKYPTDRLRDVMNVAYGITFKPPGYEFEVDMGLSFVEIKIGEHGSVALMDCMPRLVPEGTTCDQAIVQAARTSYGDGTEKKSDNTGLIRYLYRHRHTTPLEMVEFKFRHVMPVFVARQWIRHRTANVNEYSARYSVVKDRFYRPSVDDVRTQSKTNKQGSDDVVDVGTAEEFLKWLDSQEAQYKEYQSFVDKGIAREQARIGLPLTMFTEWYWKIDLHNLFHFLGLRMDSHAQKEIQDFAYPMFELIKPLCPIACQAFLDYHPNMGGMLLSAGDIAAIGGGPWPTNSREKGELLAKLDRMGIVKDEETGRTVV
jgi:thymidylate synthase (FAD)